MREIPQHWVKWHDRELTAEQVKSLEVGTKVTVIAADKYGECTRTEYKVIYSGKKKVLLMRDPYTWEKMIMPIKNYGNKKYVVAKD